MNSTPPSNARSASRLARIKRESQIPSLDLVLSSPKKNNTPPPPPPYQSSPSSPSSPVTLREILLLSPSLHRKSRTRLINRFDSEATTEISPRLRKSKGGQNGLLASPSPRSCRRTRRMVETKEDKEPIVVSNDEKNQKQRKQMKKKKKKTSLSKKEKHSSVPLLPSSAHNEDVCEGDLDRIRENIKDLIMWRDVAKSTLWFGFGCICFLSSCFAKGFDFSVFSAISNFGLLLLGASFLTNTIRQRVTEEEEVARREFKMSEEDVLRIARRILPLTNLAISKTNELFSGEPGMTLKVVPFVIIGAEYGYLITFWRLCAFGFFMSFTIPKLYSSYASQINRKIESAQERIVETWAICTHKKLVAGSIITAFWNLTSLKIRLFTVFIIVVVIRYRRQNLQLVSEEEEKPQEQTQTEKQDSPEEKSPSPSPPSPPRATEEEEGEQQALVVVEETKASKKL